MKKFLFLVIFFFACLEKPKLPEWNTEITIPLLEKKITIFSFLDSHHFVFNSDSTFNFFYQNNFDTIFPITKINFNINGFNSIYYFNNFEIYDTFYAEIIIKIEEILGVTIPDSFIILPPTNLQKELQKVISINNFRRGIIEKCFLTLNIENHSLINFRYFEINLSNLVLNLGILEPNSQKELLEIIENKFISSPINFLLIYGVLTTDSLLVRKDDYLKLIFKFTNIKLAEGELKFKNPVLNHIYKYYLNSPTDFDLNYGEIKEGYLDLDFINQFSFPLSIFLKIKEINYENSFDISPYSNKKISISLEGKIIKQNAIDKKGFLLPIEINAQIRDTENFFNIRKEDYLSLSGLIRELRFKKIDGNFFSPIYFLNKQDSLIVNFLGNPKGIKFEKVEMFLDFIYNVEVPMKIFLMGKSINRKEEACSLFKEIELPLGRGESINKINEKINITNLINNGPKVLKFNYSGRVNGKGSIQEKHFILVNVSVEAPLKFFFSKDTFIAYEREILLDKEEKEKINKNLVGGELFVEVINHFPIGFDGSVTIKSADGDSVALPFVLPGGIISEKGYCEKERKSEIVFEMDENQLEIFRKERLKALLKINLPESRTVLLRPNDFLSFNTYVVLKVKTKEIIKSMNK
ncbi:MAG: hypothetical protein ABIK56_00235 [candidate division WOR-3 bacterium]